LQPRTPPISALFRNGKKRDGVLQKISKSSPKFYKKFQKPDHSFEKKFKIQTSVLQKISKPSTASPAQPAPIHTHHPTTPNNTPHTPHTHHTHTRTHTNTAQRRLKPEGGKKEGARRKIESKPPKNRKQTTAKPGQIRKNFEKFEKI
jgi:hypothetical protein